MQIIVESLGDPIWQIGVGILVLVALVLILVLRSSDMHFSTWQQWFLPRIMGLVCLSLFLVLSAGILLFHGADAAPTSVHGTSSPPPVTTSPTVRPSTTPVPTPPPSPTPFPQLSPSPTQVLVLLNRPR